MCDSLGLFNDDNDDVRSGAAGGGRSDLELNKIKWKQIQWLASSVFRSNSLLNVFQFAFVKGFCISKKKKICIKQQQQKIRFNANIDFFLPNGIEKDISTDQMRTVQI